MVYINDKPIVNTMHMFNSSKATSIDVSSYFMKNVVQMTYMFNKSEATEIIGISNFGEINAANIGGMFDAMPNLVTLDLTGWDTKNVTNMNVLFRNTPMLTTIYVSDKFVTTNLANSAKLFGGNTNLVGGNGTHFDANHLNKPYAIIDGTNNKPGYFTEGPAV